MEIVFLMNVLMEPDHQDTVHEPTRKVTATDATWAARDETSTATSDEVPASASDEAREELRVALRIDVSHLGSRDAGMRVPIRADALASLRGNGITVDDTSPVTVVVRVKRIHPSTRGQFIVEIFIEENGKTDEYVAIDGCHKCIHEFVASAVAAHIPQVVPILKRRAIARQAQGDPKPNECTPSAPQPHPPHPTSEDPRPEQASEAEPSKSASPRRGRRLRLMLGGGATMITAGIGLVTGAFFLTSRPTRVDYISDLRSYVFKDHRYTSLMMATTGAIMAGAGIILILQQELIWRKKHRGARVSFVPTPIHRGVGLTLRGSF